MGLQKLSDNDLQVIMGSATDDGRNWQQLADHYGVTKRYIGLLVKGTRSTPGEKMLAAMSPDVARATMGGFYRQALETSLAEFYKSIDVSHVNVAVMEMVASVYKMPIEEVGLFLMSEVPEKVTVKVEVLK